MSKIAAFEQPDTRSTASKALPVAGGVALGGGIGAILGGELGQGIGGHDGTGAGTGWGAATGALAGGYLGSKASQAAKGPVTRKLLNILGGAFMGGIPAFAAGGVATQQWGGPESSASTNAAGAGVLGATMGGLIGAEAPTDKEEEVQGKIAELLGSLTPTELRQFVDSPYSREDSKMAMTLGFCDKLAEFGMVPSDMNALMSKTANTLQTASALGSVATKAMTWGTLGLVLSAVAAGNLTGKAHHSADRRFNKMEDKENVRLREKAKRLAAQRDELAEDLGSRPIQTSPAPKKAPAGRRDIVQLLD